MPFVCVLIFSVMSVNKAKSQICVCISSLGHGLVLEEEFAEPRDYLGRKLMATAGDNETEEKNCTEPGTVMHSSLYTE